MDKINHREGITVRDLKNLLTDCPDDAVILLNHSLKIEGPDGNTHKAWIFDPIIEAQCEEIEDKERYQKWRSNDKIVWLTHQTDN